MRKLLTKLAMWIIHLNYLHEGDPILYIKGTDKDYPKYLLYTADKNVRDQLIIAWRLIE